jgi:hypothetical protein
MSKNKTYDKCPFCGYMIYTEDNECGCIASIEAIKNRGKIEELIKDDK